MKGAKFYSFIGLFLSCFVHASRLHPNGERLNQAANSRVTISRWAGRADFHSQTSLVWRRENGDRFRAENTIHSRMQVGFSSCESLLAKAQWFSLDKMSSTEYIPASDVAMYLKMSSQFTPAAVDFAIASRDLLIGEAKQMFGDKWYGRLHPLLGSEADLNSDQAPAPFVTSTMWSVAGQYLNPNSGEIEIHQMPWQRDEARRELAAKFDRRKYKIVFEWGRTAQDLPREAEPLASALAGLNWQEVLALGGSIEDAWVMMHSFDPVNTKAYSMRFKNRIYPEGWTNRADALFLIPLKDVIEEFPPSLHSQRFHDLIEKSNGQLNEFTAIDFINHLDRVRVAQLDVYDTRGTIEPYPLVIHDQSIGAALQRAQIVQKFGMDPNSPALKDLAEYISLQIPQSPTWNLGQYPDLADMQYTQYFYEAQNAIEVSNLDLNLAQKDSRYIERTLLGVLTYYLKAINPGPYDPERITQSLQWLELQNVKIGLSTFEPILMGRIRALKPQLEQVFEYDLEPGMTTPTFAGMEWMHKGYATAPRAFIFSLRQIAEIARANPGLYNEAMNSMEQNIWERHLMLSQPHAF